MMVGWQRKDTYQLSPKQLQLILEFDFFRLQTNRKKVGFAQSPSPLKLVETRKDLKSIGTFQYRDLPG